MKFGAAWYPEHWPSSRWPKDIEFMKEAGFSAVRLGEFAWSTMEPREGKFEFGWLDRAVGLLARAGIDAVLGTPTAAPPAWMTSRYPEVLAVDQAGRFRTHGARCHFRASSPLYLGFCARIAGEMAKRYGGNRGVIGWQIDNEYHAVSYDSHTLKVFQQWLKSRYKTLKALNSRWCGPYWSEDYFDWSQIPFPAGGHNPALLLEFNRFIGVLYRRYQKAQIDAIRRHAQRRQWITTNFHTMGLDNFEVAKDLDLASWDLYCPDGKPDSAREAFVCDHARGLKRKNFWMMETQVNHVNWGASNPHLAPGACRLRNWQMAAHGADAVLYWQWRCAAGGQEQLHGSVIGADGRPRPVFGEVRQIGAEFRRAGPAIGGTEPESDVAFLHCYDSMWAIGFQKMHAAYDYGAHFMDYYRHFHEANIGADVIDSRESLAGYRMVVAPALWLLHEKAAANLRAFVAKGGHLVLTERTGVKDADNALFARRAPGPLADLAGVETEDSYPLLGPVEVLGAAAGELKGTVSRWAERLSVRGPGVSVLARFGKGNEWLAGRPAVTLKRRGRGSVAFVAGWADPGLMGKIVNRLVLNAGLRPPVHAPAGVECRVRSGRGKRILFLMNHSDKAAAVRVPEGRDLLKGGRAGGLARLERRGVAVIKLGKA